MYWPFFLTLYKNNYFNLIFKILKAISLASYDSFVVNQTFVLRMNICGKNRQLLVAANRYLQA
jgi:hypothetical protein